jgi:hypothetical protein
MLLKFKLYKLACILSTAIICIIILLISIAYTLPVNFQDTSLYLEIGTALIYLCNNFLGISLVKRLKDKIGISKKQIKLVTILFIIQLVPQVIGLVFIVYKFRDIIYAIPNAIRIIEHPPKNWTDYVIDYYVIASYILLPPIILLTLYHEIFTFQLIPTIKKTHNAEMEMINTIGE